MSEKVIIAAVWTMAIGVCLVWMVLLPLPI
jgi:hypothetical protein